MKTVEGIMYKLGKNTFFLSDDEPLVYAWSERDKCWKWVFIKHSLSMVVLVNNLYCANVTSWCRARVDLRNLCSGIKFDYLEEME